MSTKMQGEKRRLDEGELSKAKRHKSEGTPVKSKSIPASEIKDNPFIGLDANTVDIVNLVLKIEEADTENGSWSFLQGQLSTLFNSVSPTLLQRWLREMSRAYIAAREATRDSQGRAREADNTFARYIKEHKTRMADLTAAVAEREKVFAGLQKSLDDVAEALKGVEHEREELRKEVAETRARLAEISLQHRQALEALSQNRTQRQKAEQEAEYWANQAHEMLPDYQKLVEADKLRVENAELRRKLAAAAPEGEHKSEFKVRLLKDCARGMRDLNIREGSLVIVRPDPACDTFAQPVWLARVIGFTNKAAIVRYYDFNVIEGKLVYLETECDLVICADTVIGVLEGERLPEGYGAIKAFFRACVA